MPPINRMRKSVSLIHRQLGKTMRILAVDDEPIFLKLLEISLASAGYNQVISTTSGELALDAISSALDPFDCFILDIRMPVMDGAELCAKIRSKKKYNKTPIIMLTALKEDKVVKDAFTAGATDYVTKPIDDLELATRLKVADYAVAKQTKIDENVYLKEILGITFDLDSSQFFEAPLSMGENSGCVSISVFENYIKQLSRKNNNQVTVVGFKFSHAYRAYSLLSVENYYQTLRGIAHVLAKISKEFELLIAYSGSGYFAGVANSISPEVSAEIGRLVNNAILEMGLSDLYARDISVSVTAGIPCLHCGVTPIPAKELMLSAIESVSGAYEFREFSADLGMPTRAAGGLSEILRH